MYPSEGNISGQKNFKRPAIRLMDFFDESFLVRVPRGRARHRPLKHANFTPVLPRCQATPTKFTFVIICHRARIEGPAFCGKLRVSAVKSVQPEPKLGLTGNTPSARLKWHGKASGWHPLWRTQRRA
jgi:hypothetical protein